MRAHARAKFFSSTCCCLGGREFKKFLFLVLFLPIHKLGNLPPRVLSLSLQKKSPTHAQTTRFEKPPSPGLRTFFAPLFHARAQIVSKSVSLFFLSLSRRSLSLSLSAISSREREVSKHLRFLRERSALPSVVWEKRERASNRLKKKAHVSFLDKNIDRSH